MSAKKVFFSKSQFYLSAIAFIIIAVYFLLFILHPLVSENIASSEEVVITYADNISSAHKILIDQFNEEYSGKIRVKAIDLPFTKFSTNERKELLARSLRSKSDKLDIFAIDLIWSARFERWAVNLNDYFNENELGRILPIALKSCKYKNELVAIPIRLDIGMMYYRKDLIRSLPDGETIEKKLKDSITWDEFFNLSKEFNLTKQPFYIFPADNYEGLVCTFVEILHNKDANYFDNDTLNLQSESILSTLKFIKDIIHKYKITPIEVTNFKDDMSYNYFVNNNGVFLRGWPSFQTDYSNLLKVKEINNLLKPAALPHFKGSKASSVIGGWNIMVSKYSKNRKEAIEFVKFILREESQKKLYEYSAFLPVLSAIYQDKEFTQKHLDLVYNKQLLDSGIHRPFLENYTKISDVISYFTNKVLRGDLTIETALEKSNQALISGELIVR